MGHLVLGRDLVRDTARELGDVDPELLQMLEHIILAHPNRPEWGSPRLPLIPECLIVHHADDLDAKMEMYVRWLSKDKEPGAFTRASPCSGSGYSRDGRREMMRAREGAAHAKEPHVVSGFQRFASPLTSCAALSPPPAAVPQSSSLLPPLAPPSSRHLGATRDS